MADVYLPVESQQRLIRIARQTLEKFVSRSDCECGESADPNLETCLYGAFVTLYKKNVLRGCIGTCIPTSPLYETIIAMTEAAASRDRRVRPIQADELNQIRIDISVLSPLEESTDPLSLEIGKHGLHVSRDGKRGVLLPQVAAEYDWDIETFLEQTCVKAALPKDAWRWPGTRVSCFTALIIEEEK
jgi:AmmeMemoRadiSam system protein A